MRNQKRHGKITTALACLSLREKSTPLSGDYVTSIADRAIGSLADCCLERRTFSNAKGSGSRGTHRELRRKARSGNWQRVRTGSEVEIDGR